MSVGGPAVAADRALCASCACVLARDNSGRLCSPCSAREGRRRWLADAPTPTDGPTIDDFSRHSHDVLMAMHGLDAEQLVTIMLANGLLPPRLRRYRGLIARLLTMPNLSHTAAARELGVTRWTVAAWRERLTASPSSNSTAHNSPTDTSPTDTSKEHER